MNTGSIGLGIGQLDKDIFQIGLFGRKLQNGGFGLGKRKKQRPAGLSGIAGDLQLCLAAALLGCQKPAIANGGHGGQNAVQRLGRAIGAQGQAAAAGKAVFQILRGVKSHQLAVRNDQHAFADGLHLAENVRA